MFFTAQHVNAQEPYLHYASKRLLRDSKTEVEEITNRFNKLFANLITARQQDALEMNKKLQDALDQQVSTSRELELVRSEAQSLREEADLQQARNEEQLKQIEEYKALLKL
jgi:exonuclease VII large subunit